MSNIAQLIQQCHYLRIIFLFRFFIGEKFDGVMAAEGSVAAMKEVIELKERALIMAKHCFDQSCCIYFKRKGSLHDLPHFSFDCTENIVIDVNGDGFHSLPF